jgi:hypothetical protein
LVLDPDPRPCERGPNSRFAADRRQRADVQRGTAMLTTRQGFSVSVAPDGAFIRTRELELSTLQAFRDLVDDVMFPGRAIVLDWRN